MTLTYDEFKTKYNNKFLDYDKIHGPQCVDLIKGYLDEVFWLGKTPSLWNAKDYISTLPRLHPEFKHVKWLTGISRWDIVISTSGQYGHIAIYESTVGDTMYVFNQNGWAAWIAKKWDECRIQAYRRTFYTDYIKIPTMTDKNEIARTVKVLNILEEIKLLNQKLLQASPQGEQVVNAEVLERRIKSAINYFDQL